MKSVDIAAWDRKEIYDLFSACDHPFYSVSFELDVTNLYAHTHESGLSFYYSLCYLMTRAMEEVEAFRMRIRDGRIDIVDELIPSCTDLVPGSDAFVIVTLPHGGDMAEFCRQAKEKAAGQMYLFDREMEKLDTLVYFSCLPWFPVTGFVTERNLEIDDSIPRVTWGKYRKESGRVTLNITLDLNHRLIDGVHIGKLYQMTLDDGVEKCFCHGDTYRPNWMLLPDGDVYLIDWEYAGFSDPGIDVGYYIVDAMYDFSDAERFIREYLGSGYNASGRFHYMAYTAIIAYYWFVWALYRESCGADMGQSLENWRAMAEKYADYLLGESCPVS